MHHSGIVAYSKLWRNEIRAIFETVIRLKSHSIEEGSVKNGIAPMRQQEGSINEQRI